MRRILTITVATLLMLSFRPPLTLAGSQKVADKFKQKSIEVEVEIARCERQESDGLFGEAGETDPSFIRLQALAASSCRATLQADLDIVRRQFSSPGDLQALDKSNAEKHRWGEIANNTHSLLHYWYSSKRANAELSKWTRDAEEYGQDVRFERAAVAKMIATLNTAIAHSTFVSQRFTDKANALEAAERKWQESHPIAARQE